MQADRETGGYELSGDELRRVVESETSDRLAYFLTKCVEGGQIWTIGAADDLVVLADDDDQPFIVVFPHPDFAVDWFETTDLEDVDLVAIGIEDWKEDILHGLQEADIKVLVFPTSVGEGSLTEADHLAGLLVAS